MRRHSVLFVVFLLAGSIVPVRATETSEVRERIEGACGFLVGLFSQPLGLVRETLSKQVYYVASDNLLAWRALEVCGFSEESELILRSVWSCCGYGYGLSMMHEAVLGEAIPLPVHVANVYRIADSSTGRLFRDVSAAEVGSDYVVLWEVHNGTGILSPSDYADVAAYTALELDSQGDRTGALSILDVLDGMWKGAGFVDEPFKKSQPGEGGLYQTFKIALYILVLTRLSLPVPLGILDVLLQMQGPDGGFHTGYDSTLNYTRTDENAETTSLAIIALDQQAQATTEPLLQDTFALIIVIAAVAITLGLFVAQRRRSGNVGR